MDWGSLGLGDWTRLVAAASAAGFGGVTAVWKLFEWRRDRHIATLKEANELAENRRLAAEQDHARLERKHAEEMAALRAEYDRLLAENGALRARLGLAEWRPEPPNPFAVPPVEC